jgi:hypothetical protein
MSGLDSWCTTGTGNLSIGKMLGNETRRAQNEKKKPPEKDGREPLSVTHVQSRKSELFVLKDPTRFLHSRGFEDNNPGSGIKIEIREN